MTKKDYELIAHIIRDSKSFYNFTDKATFILDLGAKLAEDNPKFDMNKWTAACLPERTLVDTRI